MIQSCWSTGEDNNYDNGNQMFDRDFKICSIN